MNHQLHPRALSVYAYVARHIAEHGFAPTRRQIAAALGISSTSLVSADIARLVACGKLGRGDKYTSRSLTLPKRKREATLDEQAAVWLELGSVLVWHQDASGSYSGFTAWQYGVQVGSAGLIGEKAV